MSKNALKTLHREGVAFNETIWRDIAPAVPHEKYSPWIQITEDKSTWPVKWDYIWCAWDLDKVLPQPFFVIDANAALKSDNIVAWLTSGSVSCGISVGEYWAPFDSQPPPFGPNSKPHEFEGFNQSLDAGTITEDDFGTVEDGFGNCWFRCKADCGLEVMRPGKVQCYCDSQTGAEDEKE